METYCWDVVKQVKTIMVSGLMIIKVTSLLAGCWIVVSLLSSPQDEVKRRVLDIYEFKETGDSLIKTAGCIIPNYMKTIRQEETIPVNITCGVRAVFIEKSDNDDNVKFLINDTLMKEQNGNKEYECCYQFVKRSTEDGQEDKQVTYSTCTKFETGVIMKLEEEVIKVSCVTIPVLRKFYEDAYIILKKVVAQNIEVEEHWNVLVLGMDTVSRARILSAMTETVRYLKQYNWLDYKGYHKVAYNTYPNLMAFLTGRIISKNGIVYFDEKCAKGMSDCNDDMIWKKFQNSGYITAYGEDDLHLPDTFSTYHGFRYPPTDHYMRPLFLTGETERGNLICTQKLPSAIHALQYATEFVEAYKNHKFFGMFWLNSYTHNHGWYRNVASLLDNDLRKFFVTLNETGALKNTFIFFLSDHGNNFGEMKMEVEYYFEERLPMFFMWVPLDFRNKHKQAYHNSQLNQNRLTTPYDLHETFKDILRMSSDAEISEKSEGCPKCTSLFEEKPEDRTCEDARVDEKWCSCHNLTEVDKREARVVRAIQIAVSDIQNISKTVKTQACTKCHELTLKNVLRVHSHVDTIRKKTYYIIAFEMSPGELYYEASVEENDDGIRILPPTNQITKFNSRSSCVLQRDDSRGYCVCEPLEHCGDSLALGFLVAMLAIVFILLYYSDCFIQNKLDALFIKKD